MSPVAPLQVRWRIALARHRRFVVAALAGLAVAAGLQALRPPAPPTARVLVTTRDLPAGHRLTPADLVARPWAPASVPAGLLARPQGRILASPLRRGEPVTDVRVAADQAPRVPVGWTAVTVRLADPAAALLVVPGDRVQVVAGPPLDPLVGVAPGDGAPPPASVVAPEALVLAVPGRDPDARAAWSATSGSGLLDTLGDEAPERDHARDVGLPAGVLALGVPAGDALDLAAVSGVRALTVTRQFSVSS